MILHKDNIVKKTVKANCQLFGKKLILSLKWNCGIKVAHYKKFLKLAESYFIFKDNMMHKKYISIASEQIKIMIFKNLFSKCEEQP